MSWEGVRHPRNAQPNGWPSFILLDILKEFIKESLNIQKARKPNSSTIKRQTMTWHNINI
jgi:hypothetical protein